MFNQYVLEIKVIKAGVKALQKYGYWKLDGTIDWTQRASRALNFEENKFNQTLHDLGYDSMVIYYLWHDCLDMAELEVMITKG